jgi:hypothetical protein
MNQVRLGISVSLLELEKLFESGLTGALGRINHFSLEFKVEERGPFEKVGKMARNAQCTISLHPVDLNLSDKLNLDHLERVVEIANTMDAKYIEEDLGIWRISNLFMGSHLVNPMMTNDSIQQTMENLLYIQAITPISILIENPPVYWNSGPVEFWDYFTEIMLKSKANMAFDIGPYVGYCRSMERDVYLPKANAKVWDLIRTIHLSGAQLWEWHGVPVWLDRHTEPISQYLLKIATYCLRNASKAYSVLLEMEGANQATRAQNIENVIAVLDRNYAA